MRSFTFAPSPALAVNTAIRQAVLLYFGNHARQVEEEASRQLLSGPGASHRWWHMNRNEKSKNFKSPNCQWTYAPESKGYIKKKVSKRFCPSMSRL